jgi:hypothetical protein
VRPLRNRARRRRDVLERAQRLASSLKSYLIAQDYEKPAQSTSDSHATCVGKERLMEAADSLGG